MCLFDSYVFVDWSATNGLSPANPSRDAPWVSVWIPGAMPSAEQTYHRSRVDAFERVRSVVRDCVRDHLRVLVGFDFPYGYPLGLASTLHGTPDDVGWLDVWNQLTGRIEDGVDNTNNRFDVAAQLNTIIGGQVAGPYWGCPANRANQCLTATMPRFPHSTAAGVQLNRLRIVEGRLSGVQATWQLYGAGSCGSQALTGIPYVKRLRMDTELASVSKVWPFETGFTASPSPEAGPFVLHAEIWPGVVNQRMALPNNL